MDQILWGIDLGGTKTEGIVVRMDRGLQVIQRMRIHTEREKGYRHILGRIRELLAELEKGTGMKAKRIGIGTPGTLDPRTGLLKNSNTICLNGMPLLSDLESLLGIPVNIANDANCFALAETLTGAVAGIQPAPEAVFGVILGTGVGGGLVVHGKVLAGCQGIAGEWGHNFLHESGGPCYCGRTGCVETVISGTALEQYYSANSGMNIPLPELVELHLKGTDELATRVIERLLDFFARAIASVINIVDPEVVVIGGGVGNIDLLYTEGVKRVSRYIFNDIKTGDVLESFEHKEVKRTL